MSEGATELARRLRTLANESYLGSAACLLRQSADELERLHEVEQRGSGGQTGATTADDPVVLWSRPGYEREEATE